MVDPRLTTISQSAAEKLFDRRFAEKVKELSEEYYSENNIADAGELWRFLNNSLSKVDQQSFSPLVKSIYNDALLKMSWIAAAKLPETKMLNLYQFKLIDGTKLDIDLIGRAKLFFMYFFGDFDLMSIKRLLILKAVKENKEVLGSGRISIEGFEETLPLSVQNWLKDYDQTSSVEKRKSKLSLLEYMNENKNVRQLSEGEKNSLRKILELYDFLRFLPKEAWVGSSGDIGSTGHQVPKVKIQPPKEEPVVQPAQADSSAVEAEVLAAYQGDPAQQQAISKELRKIESRFKDNTKEIRGEFFAAVQKTNVIRTVAILRILAERDDLINFISTDEKLARFLEAVWEKQYGIEEVKGFRKDPSQPKYIQMFLRYILETRLQLSTNDAARLGLQIANIFVSLGKKSYNKMAYFDIKSKSFNWF